jgi:hypothetical protein
VFATVMATGIVSIATGDHHYSKLWMPPLIYFGSHRITQHPDVLQFTGAWWFWDAFAVWLIVAVAGVLRLRRAPVGQRG